LLPYVLALRLQNGRTNGRKNMSFSDEAVMTDDGRQRTWSDEGHWQRRARAGFKPRSAAEGTGYEEMFAKHGRPIGPFENGRELLYDGSDDRRS
jgi:hypothetical protein